MESNILKNLLCLKETGELYAPCGNKAIGHIYQSETRFVIELKQNGLKKDLHKRIVINLCILANLFSQDNIKDRVY